MTINVPPLDFILESVRGGSESKSESCLFLSMREIAVAKRTAFRRGTWFRAIDQVERGLIDLTLRCLKHVKSTKLAKVLVAVIAKLQNATGSSQDRLVRMIGVPLAKKVSVTAVGWGNISALAWAEDLSFARFLAIDARLRRKS